MPAIRFGTSIGDLENNYRKWSNDATKTLTRKIMPKIGDKVIKEFSAKLKDNYTRPQAKRSSKPIQASGATGQALEDQYWSKMVGKEGGLQVTWNPPASLLSFGESETGTPFGKLAALTYGSRVPRRSTQTYRADEFDPEMRDQDIQFGIFRQAILDWGVEKGLFNNNAKGRKATKEIIKMMFDRGTTQKANPPFLFSEKGEDGLFLNSYVDQAFSERRMSIVPKLNLTTEGEQIVKSAIDFVLRNVKLPPFKKLSTGKETTRFEADNVGARILKREYKNFTLHTAMIMRGNKFSHSLGHVRVPKN